MGEDTSLVHHVVGKFNDQVQRDEWFGAASDSIVLNKYKSIPGR